MNPAPAPAPAPDNNLSAGTLAAIIVPSVLGGLTLLSCLLCYCCKWCCFKNKAIVENIRGEGTDRKFISIKDNNSVNTPVLNRNMQVNGFSPMPNFNPAINTSLPNVPSVPSVPSTSFVPTVPVIPITPIVPIKADPISPKTNIINTQTSLGVVDSNNQVLTGRFNQVDINNANTNTNLSLGTVDKNMDSYTRIENQSNN